MKFLLFFVLMQFIFIGGMGQTTLTFSNNSLHTCDSNSYDEIQFTDPGNAGANQVWDFSKNQYTGKNLLNTIQDAAFPKMSSVGFYNLSLVENGYDYMMNATESQLEELGYVNTEQKLTLTYSDPVVKMKYPFSYGNRFTDHFNGIAMYNETSKIDFFGDCSVAADGYGKLILPDKVLEGSLRVKTVKTGLQVNICGTTDINIVKYSWYAPGYRYPVMNMSIVANSINGASPVVTQTAHTNLKQNFDKRGIVNSNSIAQSIANLTPTGDAAIKVVVSPNPFDNILNYNYVLGKQMNVSIGIYDQLGKLFGTQLNNQPQSAGSHFGELNAANHGLTPGVYYIRFTFDAQIVTCKVVKM